MKKPNVLLFFTDDQRFDTIRALGNDAIHTPNLDELVERGTCFTHAHIPGGTSAAVCMPSRAMLHTGRTLFHLDREGQAIPEEHTTLGECFRSSGYDTFGTGKWHNGKSAFARSFSSGDEIFFGGMQDHWNVPAHRFDPEGRYEGHSPYVANPFASNHVAYCDHINAGKHSTELFVDASINFLQNRKADNPFLMYVSLMAPHDPRTMPKKFLDLYDPEQIDLPENFAPQHEIDTGALDIRDELLAEFPRKPDEIKRHIAEYYAMITYLDDALGRLISALKEAGEFENTIIVFAGDNGLALGQHGLMGKQSLYDHSVRVPLIMAGPNIPSGETKSSLVYLLDIFPTLTELCGLPLPESVEGKSLVPVLKGDDESARSSLYLAYGDSIRGVTKNHFKLIEYACGDTQLFSLGEDPLEVQNLAEERNWRVELSAMRQLLKDLSAEWDDRGHPLGQRFWSLRGDLQSEKKKQLSLRSLRGLLT